MTEDVTRPSPQDSFAAVLASSVQTIVSGYDFFDLAHSLATSTVTLLAASAAGVMLEDRSGALQVIAASDEDTHVLEVFELQRKEGPCFDCWRDGAAVSEADIASSRRWPHFAVEAAGLGYHSAIAVPLRLRNKAIGALNVFWQLPHEPSPQDVWSAQALADVAAISLVQQRLNEDTRILTEQLQQALQTRVLIEQAKGMVAYKRDSSPDEAFADIESFAHQRGVSMRDVARLIVDREIDPEDLGFSR